MMPIDVEKPELARPAIDRSRVFGILDAAAHDGVDVDVEVRVLREPLQLRIEQPQALLRHFVRLDVVDADLQIVEPRVVQRLDSLRGEQVAVGDQSGDHAVRPDPADQGVEIRMEHRLAAAECDDRRSEVGQLVDPREHRLGRHRLGHLVVLVAVAAVDVAAADRHEMDEQRMIGAGETAREFADGPQRSARLPESTHQIVKYIRSRVPTQPIVP